MIRVNLIKEEGKERAKTKLYLLLYGLSVTGVVATTIFLIFSYGAILSELQERVESLRSQKLKLDSQTKEVANLEAQREELKKKLQIIAQLKKSKKGPVQVLDRINLALPDKSWLSAITEVSDSGMEISGYSLENDLVSIFAEDLGQSKFFPKVTIDEIIQEDFKDIKVSKFRIVANVSFDGAGKSNETVNEVKNSNG